MSVEAQEPASVLVADDEPSNRTLLRQVLARGDYRVREAEDGFAALRCAREERPDAVLLDVMMPGMDGFQVCRTLKADPELAAVPVVLVTSLDGREDRLQGVEAGADDFLVKPIDPREVLFRVRNAVRTHRLFREVEDSYRRLHELESLRDNLTHMLVHDFRSPLQSVLGYLRLLRMDAVERLTRDETGFLDRAMSCAELLTEMVGATLDVSRMEGEGMPLNRQPMVLSDVARRAAADVAGIAQETPIRIEEHGELRVEADPDVVRRVLMNLLANALKFSPPGEAVVVYVDGNRVEVHDRGPGIPADERERIFDKFVQLKAWEDGGRHSSGLGLTFCQLAVQAHGGRIGVDCPPQGGSTFWFTLPLEET